MTLFLNFTVHTYAQIICRWFIDFSRNSWNANSQLIPSIISKCLRTWTVKKANKPVHAGRAPHQGNFTHIIPPQLFIKCTCFCVTCPCKRTAPTTIKKSTKLDKFLTYKCIWLNVTTRSQRSCLWSVPRRPAEQYSINVYYAISYGRP